MYNHRQFYNLQLSGHFYKKVSRPLFMSGYKVGVSGDG